MHAFVPAILLILLAACSSSPPAASAPPSWIELREPLAYDGDTLYATATTLPPELAEISIRVRGVDTPEIRGGCEAERAWAIEARDYVRAVLDDGARVSLADLEWDKYGGRVLATVRVDAARGPVGGRGPNPVPASGRDLAALLIERGLGRPYDGGQRQPWC